MPNALAHLMVGEAASRRFVRASDLRWIYLGCVLPDLPWIARRAASAIPAPLFDTYDAILYATAQSSWAACLLLAGALALCSSAPRRVFAILAGNSLLHLLLDATQTKWGNGVHVLAPLDWRAWNLELFWPESLLTVVLTLAGLVLCLHHLLHGFPRPEAQRDHAARRRGFQAAAVAFLGLYLLLPALVMEDLKAAGNHSVTLLTQPQIRPGRRVAFDRQRLGERDGRPFITTYSGEELLLEGEVPDDAHKVSLEGVFVDQQTVRISRIHGHPEGIRDLATYVGLLFVVLAWWAPPGLRSYRRRRPPSTTTESAHPAEAVEETAAAAR